MLGPGFVRFHLRYRTGDRKGIFLFWDSLMIGTGGIPSTVGTDWELSSMKTERTFLK